MSSTGISSLSAKRKGEGVGMGADLGKSQSSSQGTSIGKEEYRRIPTDRADLILAKNISQLAVNEKPTAISKGNSRKTTLVPPKCLQDAKASNARGKLTKLQDVAALIRNRHCRNIVVMAGAGISTASGIPDFRTPGTGLYDNLEEYNVPYPEAIFDESYFVHNPLPFFSLAKKLYTENYKPNYIHYFLRMLHEKGLLLRLYTQNIDGLERMAGIPSIKMVEAHGTFLTASCSSCRSPYPASKAKAEILSDKIPKCKRCTGIVKPDIVFFGEDLPKRFHSLYRKDFYKSDLLIVMGTSLEIEPFAGIVNSVQPNVPRLLLNRDPVGPFQGKCLKKTDVRALGDLTKSIQLFVDMVGWKNDLDELIQERALSLKDQVSLESNTEIDSDTLKMSPSGNEVPVCS
ncbi:NAD-dependent protein deacetylase sirtuin-3 isoform X2 [Callorhinchus milii]|uniref:NAD-dependent protein deacetylase sirtuin-3 isoform X2 n=1 Tax=Callorhinchus milii TaxID=7868 RepID=UPI00045751C5|nr:NAD-dependent protein deacetylase sirtuin-3 isoform X2 [Callorhinchus milii]|eukprot:gi/632955740/ref/XP_007893612.1/ PREDICTED: NAD-dependent protein deacetylase sirtuin-3-like isoform X2 [Callorhinchus milii]